MLVTYIKFQGDKDTDIPSFIIHADREAKRSVDRNSEVYRRFDWIYFTLIEEKKKATKAARIKVPKKARVPTPNPGTQVEEVENESMRPGQIMALLALVSEHEEEEFGGQKFALMYAAFPCKLSGARVASRKKVPFPVIKYDVNPGSASLDVVVDFVDSITLPAMIQPLSMNPDDYFETNYARRATLEFVSVPYKFLHRDGWENVASVQDNLRLLDVDSSFAQGGVMTKFLRGSTTVKNNIILEMKETATSCRMETISENDLIQAAFENITG